MSHIVLAAVQMKIPWQLWAGLIGLAAVAGLVEAIKVTTKKPKRPAAKSAPAGPAADVRKPKEKPTYRVRRSLLVDNELRFHKALQVAADKQYVVCTKVNLSDVIEAADQFNGHNEICQKHVDFVLCDPLSWEPRIIVELDGVSHATDKQRDRDMKKDDAIRSAGLPILRFKNQPAYDVQQIRNIIAGSSHLR